MPPPTPPSGPSRPRHLAPLQQRLAVGRGPLDRRRGVRRRHPHRGPAAAARHARGQAGARPRLRRRPRLGRVRPAGGEGHRGGPVERPARSGPRGGRGGRGEGRAPAGRAGRPRLRPGRRDRRRVQRVRAGRGGRPRPRASARCTGSSSPSARWCSRSPTRRSRCSRRPPSTPLAVHRRYHDPSLVTWYHGDDEVVDHPRTVSSVFTSLTRANFRVDAILEPEVPDEALRSHSWADLMQCVPATIIYRARKLGHLTSRRSRRPAPSPRRWRPAGRSAEHHGWPRLSTTAVSGGVEGVLARDGQLGQRGRRGDLGARPTPRPARPPGTSRPAR